MSPSLTSSAALELQALHNTGQTFPVVVQLMNATRWGHAAALALISYDTLLTFRDEVQYIWPMKLSIIKVLIYGNRLSALSVILIHAGPMVGLNRSFTTKDCQGIFIASGSYELNFPSLLWLSFLARDGCGQNLMVCGIRMLLSSGVFNSKLDHVGTYKGTVGRKQDVQYSLEFLFFCGSSGIICPPHDLFGPCDFQYILFKLVACVRDCVSVKYHGHRVDLSDGVFGGNIASDDWEIVSKGLCGSGSV
ncbi:hypothetical protein FRC18_002720 [Serendipita sp. 400]|nr:hypothetical protein FRC18_002720 [Serendipita sp. 400]